MATTLTEIKHAGAAIISEEDMLHCRDNVTVAVSQTIPPNSIVGKGAATSTVSAAVFTGTGNGTFTPATPAFSGTVRPGTYNVRLVDVIAAGGVFSVVRPDGTVDGYALVGTAYDGEIKFTLADGSTDFSGAANFAVPVTVDTVQWKLLNMSGTDGSQVAAGYAIYGVTTTSGATQQMAIIVRGPAQLRDADLSWTTGMSAAQKVVARAQLAALGIVVRV